MSLTEVQTVDVVKKQIGYKWRAYTGVFMSLVIIQLLGVLFSLNGSGSGGYGRTGYDIMVQYFSGDIIIVFTIFWGFLTALLFTTRAYREDDFSFITNRTSSTISTILFLFVISVIGGFTSLLSGYLLKVLTYILFPEGKTLLISNPEGPGVWIMGLVSVVLIIFMFSSIGYLAGMMIQWNKLFLILLPVLLFGSMTWLAQSGVMVGEYFYQFYFQEKNFILYVMKTIVSTTGLYTFAAFISNHLEVKK
ncbi:hypothetical protein [Halobacillus litoralis]|uniref:hypothetical protein n=1 Tax=Halobacillus litoralis TaxID=45668 RepID=UPI001CFF131E|nr:hypothetical protein [Halobacillus litoralis]